ncbi:transposase [Clostridium sporogenes]|nr:transposase [Clostridium sporogenes]MDS1001900.1 transposase [Clostridium sporogenes]
MSKKNNQYSKELKLKAVNMYIDSGMSALQVAKILNVKCKT